MPEKNLLTHSLTHQRWVVEPCDERLAEALSQRFSLPDIVARVMASRGIALDEAPDFLEPTLRRLLPDPFHLRDMDKAARRVADAIKTGEKVAVFGDYDVDGATSAALLIRYMKALDRPLTLYVPDHMKEGYGPQADAMAALAEKGIKLLITVDCGITAHEPLRMAQEKGMDVIVLDHHVAEPQLPVAVAVVNPNRLDETSPHRHMAAVGVTFLFLVALARVLRSGGFFGDRKEPDLMAMLDLVALGTVADVVPLKGINRAFVRQGLKVMSATQNNGLAALLKSGRAEGPADTYTAGFVLGPRVNAGGRVGKSDLGARLLSTEDEAEAESIAATLETYNDERRQIEQEALAQALLLVPEGQNVCLCVKGPWHPGVIGLVASRLKDRFGLPTLVCAFDGTVGKGSCRSIKGIDIGAVIIAAKQEGLLINGGGHSMAAGFTVSAQAYDAFTAFVRARIAKQLDLAPIEPTLRIDGILRVGGANVGLVEKIQVLAPFGASHPEPRFAIMDAKLIRADIVGEKHVRVILSDDTGGSLKGIAFRAMDGALGPALLSMKKGARLHAAGTLRLNSWAMREDAQLIIDDVASADKPL